MQGFVFDIEADNLYPAVTQMWYIKFKSLDHKRSLKVNPYNDSTAREKVLEWVNSFPDGCLIIGHNILQYDIWVLWKLLSITPKVGKRGSDWIESKPVNFIDTRYLSMFLNPDLPGHSLEEWGERVGVRKINYRGELIKAGVMTGSEASGHEFSFHHPLMEVYCDQDVETNLAVFSHLWAMGEKVYSGKWVHPSFRAGQKDFFLMGAQEFTGVSFDAELGRRVEEDIKILVEDLANEVEPLLPPRAMKKGELKNLTLPLKPFKANGELSSHMLNFIAKHSGEVISNEVFTAYGKEWPIISNFVLDIKVPMKLKDQEEIKDWFIEQGWSPTFYNVKKDSNGKPMRDATTRQLITTSPKLQDSGKICPNLLELEGELPKKIVRYLSLRNRLGVLQGWLSHERLGVDGRLPSRSSKITPTFRHCHAVVCNVPKASKEVLFGYEFRSLFRAEPGMVFVSADAAAGENRTEAHYTLKYDGGAYAEELLKADPHVKNAKAFYPLELSWVDLNDPEAKEDPRVKPFRSKAKNGKYALTFGCSADKLAKTLGKPSAQGKVLYDAFWDANPALKDLRAAVENYWTTVGQKKYLPGIDGRILCTRTKHALLNMLFQSALAVAMSYACCLMDTWLGDMHLDEGGKPYYMYKGFIVRRVLYYHDEFTFECPEACAEEIRKLLEKSIMKGGELCGLKIPLAGEGKVGLNWAMVH